VGFGSKPRFETAFWLGPVLTAGSFFLATGDGNITKFIENKKIISEKTYEEGFFLVY